MHPLLNVADRAARRAGDIILRAFERRELLTIREKQIHDYVTEIDQRAEKDIIETIRRNYPDHSIIGEETGSHNGKQPDYEWIIDPLDGTTNFIHGLPHFGISIAIRHKNRIEHGLIYDPLKQEIFNATRGEGAYCNQRRMRVSIQNQLPGSLLTTGFVYQTPEQLGLQLKLMQSFTYEAGCVRQSGSSALDLAYVAAGRLDGLWDIGSKIWDVAAGTLMVQEAGGFVSSLTGEEDYLITGDTVAGTPKVFKQMLQIMKPLLLTSLYKS